MKLLIPAITLILLLACAAFWVWHEADAFLETAPSAQGEQVIVDIPQKAAMSQIADLLAERGIITNARNFRWLARFRNKDQKLQAGRFALRTDWLPDQVLETLVNGKPVLYRVTIPEGLTWWQTGKLLEEVGLARYEDFRNVVFDPDFLRHYGIPFKSAEGFLMPDTYLVHRPDSPMPTGNEPDSEENRKIKEEWQKQARSVAGRMVDNFWRKADSLWNGARPDREALKKAAILASIVEKETRLDEERSRVAGVYANRIDKNMLLQADPTVIYGLGEEFNGQLLRKHLNDASNPYNTYQRAGLPPGPISSFGAAALKAALYPEKHDYIYFVAKTDGGAHVFSRTLDEHNRAVDDYRRQKRK